MQKTKRWTSRLSVDVDDFAMACFDLDLQNLIRSSVGASKYFMYVSSTVLQPFMRYHGNKICPDKQTNRRTDILKTWCLCWHRWMTRAQRWHKSQSCSCFSLSSGSDWLTSLHFHQPWATDHSRLPLHRCGTVYSQPYRLHHRLSFLDY